MVRLLSRTLQQWHKLVRRKSTPPSLPLLNQQWTHSGDIRSLFNIHSLIPYRRIFSPFALSSSLLGFRSSLFKLGSIGQLKHLFIQTQSTPNPHSLMFLPGKIIMEEGSANFPNSRAGMSSPLAKSLFRIDGVLRVYFGSNFVTITKSEDSSWDILKPEVFAAIMDFYASKQPLFYDSVTSSPSDTAIKEDDDEIVAMIKELIETRIRPAVQEDGGDIEYHGFDPETGIVRLRMQGACSGCPSSSVTLKSGIQNMLMHYVPEVKGVEEVKDGDAEDIVGANGMD